MLANFFGKTDPANLIIIFGLFLSYFLAAYFIGFSSSDSLLWLGTTIGLFVFLFFFFNFILAKNKLTLYNSYGFLFFVMPCNSRLKITKGFNLPSFANLEQSEHEPEDFLQLLFIYQG